MLRSVVIQFDEAAGNQKRGCVPEADQMLGTFVGYRVHP
jgi:hypothetical protein